MWIFSRKIFRRYLKDKPSPPEGSLHWNLASPRLLQRDPRRYRRLAVFLCALAGVGLVSDLAAQQSAATYTWQQLLNKFEASNPTLTADRLNIDESKAAEITAYLRPNPDLSITTDGFQVSRNMGVWRPLSGVVETPGISYLHEREHKRELRRDQAKASTAVAESTYLDQERNLIFNLRNSFVQAL